MVEILGDCDVDDGVGLGWDDDELGRNEMKCREQTKLNGSLNSDDDGDGRFGIRWIRILEEES